MNSLKENNNELDVRNREDLLSAFNSAQHIISKNYINLLSQLEVVELDKEIEEIALESCTRFFKINKLVNNKTEDMLEKLITVVSSVGQANGSITVILKSDGRIIDYYMGVINKNSNNDLMAQYDILEGTFKGNFLGSDIKKLGNSELKRLTSDIFDNEYENEWESIATSVSGIPSLRIEEGKDIVNFIQGLEKLSDSMRGKEFTAIFIGDSISKNELSKIKFGYEQLYSQFSPFLKSELSFNESDTFTNSEALTEGITNNISNSISYTQNQSESNGWNTSKTLGESKTTNYGGGVAAIGAGIGTALGTVGGPAGMIAGGAIGGIIGNVAGSLIGSTSNSDSVATGDNYNSTKGTSEANTKSEGISNTKQSTNTITDGNTKGRSIQISYENKTVKSVLEQIDNQLNRLKTCDDYGCFNFAAYFISNDPSVNKIAASTYNALMRGESSSVETSFINTWKRELDNKNICKYLKKFSHPVFKLKLRDDEWIKVTPANIISSKEIALQLILPKKSVLGLNVIEGVEFGREILSSGNNSSNLISLGNIYHMNNCEDSKINLDMNSLSMHTFITGSTGTGKSNTMYKILDEANKKGVKFLVVEPAKGEYKNIFGNRDDVSVFGTNSKVCDLLKINPFKFNNQIHVLEHIDKLVEIFNVCWPMYAAMPAVLKDSIERSYEESGWDLDYSINKYSDEIFPTFNDVLYQLNEVIKSSAFSEELKGNYIGALTTRVKSLTNGINGQIFSCDEIDNNILFDSNVIIDLSRVASSETKSLIMGIIIMRLQEHRMSQGGMNLPLKHITVLEEAHNILKRTSTEQTSEGANLVGKSVEMIANAIAEMRTYGEGFVIVDQSPSMVDMSAIRNTNTKIILRTPEFNDRELVGKAASLNAEQIEYLSKLENGVAAIYQNNWVEPVLGKIEKLNVVEEKYVYDTKPYEKDININSKIIKILLGNHVGEKVDFSIEEVMMDIKNSNLPGHIIVEVLEALNKEELGIADVSNIIYHIFNDDRAFEKAKRTNSFEAWNQVISKNTSIDNCELKEEFKDAIIQCLLREKAIEDNELEEFYLKWTEFMRGRAI